VPHHPQRTRTSNAEAIATIIKEKLLLLSAFLQPSTVFLELGAGDCRLSLKVAERVQTVYALDVSDEITGGIAPPANFKLVISDGTSIPVLRSSVSVAYSYQLMEHIHPDDAAEQLRNVYDVLAPGGIYICITPNRLAGPHDISRYFETVAKGFHLKEYTLAELDALFRATGFHDVKVRAGGLGRFTGLPIGPVRALERMMALLPAPVRRKVANAPIVRNVLLAAMIGRK
jgi:SAM-dependent methyltransferase